MPSYTFKDNETGELIEKFMSISAREEFLKQNPNLEQVITGAPMFCDPVRVGVTKTDSGFKEVLSKIAEKAPASNLADKLSRK